MQPNPNSPAPTPSAGGTETHSPEPELLADADVALLGELPLAEAGDDAPRPPPLPPKSLADGAPALPDPATDPTLSASPAKAAELDLFAPAGTDWEKVLASVPALPEVRTEQLRAPPVLPQVAPPAQAPPALAPTDPAPRLSTPPAPVPWSDVEEEPSFAAGPPSMADVLFGRGAPAASAFVAGERQVVIHSREGQTLRGSLRDVDLGDSTLPLETRGGTVRIPVDRVRAVFFMVPIGEALPEPRGRTVRVVFDDGRAVTGLVEDFRHDDPGFFLMPVETRGRTERIYLYRDAVREVEFVR